MALLLLVSAAPVWAEDEPAARAPLPPPPPSVPAEAGERQRPELSSEAQSIGPAPGGSPVRSTKVPIIGEEASPPLRLRSRHKDGQTASNSAVCEPLQGYRLSSANPPRRYSPKKPEAGSVADRGCDGPSLPTKRLSRSAKSGAPPTPNPSRDNLHPSIIPITLPARPHMVMRRAIPMNGHRPDLGSFGKGDPSPECRMPL